MFIVLGTLLAVTVAILLNEVVNRRARQAYQILILVPYLISMVIVSYIVFAFLSQDNGFLNNSILHKTVAWYSEPKYWPFILTLVYLWKGFGYSSIIYFSTILGIDQTLYELALWWGYKMAARSLYYIAGAKDNNHNNDTVICRTYLLFRLWPFLSSSHAFGAVDGRNKHH